MEEWTDRIMGYVGEWVSRHILPHSFTYTPTHIPHKSILLLVLMLFLPLNSPFAQADLTIDRCVSMALRNNEQILKAEQALSEAKGTLTVVHSDEYFQMDFTTSYQRAKSGEDVESRAYNGTLRADQLLARFGGVPKRLDSAQEKYRTAELALQSARVDVGGTHDG